MSEEIKDLEQVLLPNYLGRNRKIVRCNINRLTAPGENYGSLMLAVDLKIKNTENGDEHELHIVAKAVPKNEFIQKMFKSPLTFKKELEFYKTIVPTLRKFQKEEGIDEVMDFFPEFYGGRLGLGPNPDSFDNNAIILLENLKTRGFICADRTKGFDLEEAKFILKDLSTLHAVTIALKLNRPEVFQEKLLPYLNNVRAFEAIDENTQAFMIESVINIAGECPECIPLLDRMKSAMEESSIYFKNPKPPREPFSTLIHCDFWVNNTMIKIEDNRIVANKIVDFQIIEYGSPAKDLIFFIFDSVKNDIVVEHYNYLVEFYHENFRNTLEKFNIDTNIFSLDKFNEEINLAMKEPALIQCFIMIQPIFAEKHSVKDLEDFSEKDFLEKVEVSQSHKEKLWMITKEFAKRNWI